MELLRTSTPEPNPWGISWSVEKDVTRYLTIFLKPETARLSIPNNVDKTYDGVFYVNASLSFYGLPPEDAAATPQLSTTTLLRLPSLRTKQGKPKAPQATIPAPPLLSKRAAAQMPLIVPLTDPFAEGGAPWAPLAVAGSQSLGATIEWPASNIVHAYLDVYASNHQVGVGHGGDACVQSEMCGCVSFDPYSTTPTVCGYTSC